MSSLVCLGGWVEGLNTADSRVQDVEVAEDVSQVTEDVSSGNLRMCPQVTEDVSPGKLSMCPQVPVN